MCSWYSPKKYCPLGNIPRNRKESILKKLISVVHSISSPMSENATKKTKATIIMCTPVPLQIATLLRSRMNLSKRWEYLTTPFNCKTLRTQIDISFSFFYILNHSKQSKDRHKNVANSACVSTTFGWLHVDSTCNHPKVAFLARVNGNCTCCSLKSVTPSKLWQFVAPRIRVQLRQQASKTAQSESCPPQILKHENSSN